MIPLITAALKLAPFLIPEAVRALGGDKAAETAEKVIGIAKKVTGEDSPESAVEAILASPEQALEFQKVQSQERLEFARLALEERKLYIQDTQDARKSFGADRAVFWLGMAILSVYGMILAGALYGAYWLLVEGGLAGMDAGTVAAVFGLIGAIVGYIASDAKQVVSYYFGSSRGSADKSDRLSEAFTALVKGKA